MNFFISLEFRLERLEAKIIFTQKLFHIVDASNLLLHLSLFTPNTK